MYNEKLDTVFGGLCILSLEIISCSDTEKSNQVKNLTRVRDLLEERRKGYIDNVCKGMFIQKAILSMLSKDVARTGEEEGEWKASRVDRLEVFFWNQVLE